MGLIQYERVQLPGVVLCGWVKPFRVIARIDRNAKLIAVSGPNEAL